MLQQIKNIASLIRNKLSIARGQEPELGIILGSGLGDLVERIEVLGRVSYADIEGFPQSTVVGHAGEFIYGRLGSVMVLAMNGRVHYYEGYAMEQVVLPVRVMCSLGISHLVASNAAGGLNESFDVGDIMIIDDHINLLPNPLIGPNFEEFGTRFPAMTDAYNAAWRAKAAEIGATKGLNIKHGVYVASSGPSYETPAESRYLRLIGADAMGMSTVPEVIVARHHGVEVFGLSLISNMGLGSKAGAASHEEVFMAAKRASAAISDLVESLIKEMIKR